MVKERNYIIALVLLVIALIFVVYISGIQETGYVVLGDKEKVSTETVTEGVIRETIEEENIVGRAIRLDECLEDCQYKICKKNCVMEDTIIEPECFRNCLDGCNHKCLKVYKW